MGDPIAARKDADVIMGAIKNIMAAKEQGGSAMYLAIATNLPSMFSAGKNFAEASRDQKAEIILETADAAVGTDDTAIIRTIAGMSAEATEMVTDAIKGVGKAIAYIAIDKEEVTGG